MVVSFLAVAFSTFHAIVEIAGETVENFFINILLIFYFIRFLAAFASFEMSTVTPKSCFIGLVSNLKIFKRKFLQCALMDLGMLFGNSSDNLNLGCIKLFCHVI